MSDSDGPRRRRRRSAPSARRSQRSGGSRNRDTSRYDTRDRNTSRYDTRDRNTSRYDTRDRNTSRYDTRDRNTSRYDTTNRDASRRDRTSGGRRRENRRSGTERHSVPRGTERGRPRPTVERTADPYSPPLNRYGGEHPDGLYDTLGGYGLYPADTGYAHSLYDTGTREPAESGGAGPDGIVTRTDGGGTRPDGIGTRTGQRTRRTAHKRTRRRSRRRRGLLPRLLPPVLLLAVVLFAGNHLLFREPVQQMTAITDPDADMETVAVSSLSVLPENLPEELRGAGVRENAAGADRPASSDSADADDSPAPSESGDGGVAGGSPVLPDTPEPELETPAQEAAPKTRKPQFFTILVAGVDNGNGGSDTMILAAVDVKEKRITGISLPRDTKCYVEDQAWKLNYAFKSGGMERLAKTVSWQLGIPIDYTVEVDLDGFAALVDAIGGVDFYVPIDMDYDDPKQNLYIWFREGMQHLNGEQALLVVRFRHNWDGTGYGDEDLGRMRTQQNFLKAVAKQVLTPASATKLGAFVDIFKTYVDTNLTVGNMAWLGRQAIVIGADGVQFATLPGTWKVPYIYLDQDKVLDMLNEMLNPYEEPMTAQDLHLAT